MNTHGAMRSLHTRVGCTPCERNAGGESASRLARVRGESVVSLLRSHHLGETPRAPGAAGGGWPPTSGRERGGSRALGQGDLRAGAGVGVGPERCERGGVADDSRWSHGGLAADSRTLGCVGRRAATRRRGVCCVFGGRPHGRARREAARAGGVQGDLCHRARLCPKKKSRRRETFPLRSRAAIAILGVRAAIPPPAILELRND